MVGSLWLRGVCVEPWDNDNGESKYFAYGTETKKFKTLALFDYSQVFEKQ